MVNKQILQEKLIDASNDINIPLSEYYLKEVKEDD